MNSREKKFNPETDIEALSFRVSEMNKGHYNLITTYISVEICLELLAHAL